MSAQQKVFVIDYPDASEFGVSFSGGFNPDEEVFFACESAESAHRLARLIDDFVADQIKKGCHTTAENYEHFLSVMGEKHDPNICNAYFSGADAPHAEFVDYMKANPSERPASKFLQSIMGD